MIGSDFCFNDICSLQEQSQLETLKMLNEKNSRDLKIGPAPT